jgi:hypothetical protein
VLCRVLRYEELPDGDLSTIEENVELYKRSVWDEKYRSHERDSEPEITR